MNKNIFGAAALLIAAGLPGVASAASTAIATTNVNLRAGPSTDYPAVNVVQAGYNVRVYGCLSNRSWCDVSYGPQRGWMSSNYLAYVQDGRRYTGERVVGYIGAPTIGFSVGSYWDDHYRGRSFYRERDRWDRRGGWDRHDRRGGDWRDRRDHRGDWEDRRDDRDRDRRAGWEERRDRGDDRGRDDRGRDNRGRDDRGPGPRPEPRDERGDRGGDRRPDQGRGEGGRLVIEDYQQDRMKQ
jgi:uncharacterized protein YraI